MAGTSTQSLTASTTSPESMDPKLYKAARDGKIDLLASVMEGDSPPDLTLCLTPQKNTVLHIAVQFGSRNIVEKVIQVYRPSLISQPNSKGDTPLHVAARKGNLDLIKLLTPTLEEGASWREAGIVAWRMTNLQGSNAVHEALKRRINMRVVDFYESDVEKRCSEFKNKQEEMALHLLKYEGTHALARDVNAVGESLLYLAAEAGLDKVVEEIIQRGDYSTQGPDRQNPLHIAVIKGRLEVVKILVDLVPAYNFVGEVDVFGKTALHYASIIGDYGEFDDESETRIKILELLLKAHPSLAYVSDNNGDYPVHIAAIIKDSVYSLETIIKHCPDSAELVNKKGQNALHLAVMEVSELNFWCWMRIPELINLINEPDDNGDTPLHLAIRNNRQDIIWDLLRKTEDNIEFTVTNKQGLTAMDICGYTENEHEVRDQLREEGAVPSRHLWQEQLFLPFPSLPSKVTHKVNIRSELKSAIKKLPIVTILVATVTFAAAFTVPGGYKTNGSHEGMPIFMRKAALQAFVISDTIAFCTSLAVTILLTYANARSEDAFLISRVLKMSVFISVVAILSTIIAFVTAVYVLTSKESLWAAVISLLLGCAVPIFIFSYVVLVERERDLLEDKGVKYVFRVGDRWNRREGLLGSLRDLWYRFMYWICLNGLRVLLYIL